MRAEGGSSIESIMKQANVYTSNRQYENAIDIYLDAEATDPCQTVTYRMSDPSFDGITVTVWVVPDGSGDKDFNIKHAGFHVYRIA